MPLILKSKIDRAVAQLAHQSAMRSTNELVDQLQRQVRELQAQLTAEREQHAFNCNQYEETIRGLLRDLLQEKYQAAKAAFSAASSPSPWRH
jgi:hypothetical protein